MAGRPRVNRNDRTRLLFEPLPPGNRRRVREIVDWRLAEYLQREGEFEWQSQNRATQSNSYGLRVKNTASGARPSTCSFAGTGGSMAAPRRSSTAARWRSRTGKGEGPITVRWRLKEAVPQRLWAELKVLSLPAS
jgi:hypothetical protein